MNAKAQSALLPDMTSLNIDVVDEMLVKDKVVEYNVSNEVETNEADIVYQRLDTLYMYENANTTNATAIQINGAFNGTPVAQRVEFMKEDPATGVKEQLPIGRNNLYTIKIRPSQDSTTVSFGIEVEDWTNAVGDTMTIEPKKVAPVLKDLTEDEQIVGATRTDKRIEITDLNAFTGTLSFTAEGNQDSEFAIQYVGRSGATWLSVEDLVTKGELEGFTKASPILKRKYTIDFSKAKLDELKSNSTVPSDALILIQNTNAATICDTIRICFRPDYDKTGLKPVLMRNKNGKEYFWAPVNVGATQVASSIPEVKTQKAWDALSDDQRTAIFNQCGYYYQWGRKTGFKMPLATAMDTANVAEVGWPTGQGALADFESNLNWQSKFIIRGTTATHGRDTQYNWLLFTSQMDNPAKGDVVTDAWYQNLWNKNEVAGTTTVPLKVKDYDPCPDGWRVPTVDEWEVIRTSSTKGENNGTVMVVIGAEADNNLIFPAAGARSYDTGEAEDVGVRLLLVVVGFERWYLYQRHILHS
ncbi:MAG: hypothetical protein LUD46_09000 [Parabacteroides sp.]|nr:hypothetical protein [Parabacteroides sp.]